MRTTLTLDDDVAALLRAELRRTGKSFKALVNDLLRSALAFRRNHRTIPRFTVRPRPMGTRPDLDYDRISELVEELEGPLRR